MSEVLVFGDSIVFGAWDEEGGWVQRLRKFVDRRNLEDIYFDLLIYNLGVSGNNTEDLLKRFESDTKQRLDEGEQAEVIVFAIGTNDSQFVKSENNFRITPEKFKENLQKLINIAKKFSSKVIFIGLTPVDESKTMPIPWNTDKFYKNEYIEKYNEIIESVCKENDIYFIDIFKEIIKTNFKNLLQDGLHPNSEGHKIIFEKVKDFLIANEIISI